MDVSARKVKVTGPRGSLEREFKHIPCAMTPGAKVLKIDIFHGVRKHLACLRTICSHVENMIVGVTKGYLYRMRLVYAHFPIKVSLGMDGKQQVVEVRNYIGQRRLRKVPVLPGCKVIKEDAKKDELEVTGNDIEAVSRMAALVHQSCLVRRKDIRKFLDGLYVAEKGAIGSLKMV